jgi:hypothetical protein
MSEKAPGGTSIALGTTAQSLTFAVSFSWPAARADCRGRRTDASAGGTPTHSLPAGDSVFTKSLTIVLPVHNAETRLRRNVGELLELASELTANFSVLIIDDGSTDATYEVAEELASHFPQVSVRRHRQCLGLGASLEYVQRRVRSDAVIVHDGVTPINSREVRDLWREWLDKFAAGDSRACKPASMLRDTIDVSTLQLVHASMERVHRQAIGFQLLSASPTMEAQALNADSKAELPRSDASHVRKCAGVGRIPSPPRPKFFSALAEFALGE